MITLVSPAKKLDFSHSNISSQFSQCDFLNKSQILIDETKKMSDLQESLSTLIDGGYVGRPTRMKDDS